MNKNIVLGIALTGVSMVNGFTAGYHYEANSDIRDKIKMTDSIREKKELEDQKNFDTEAGLALMLLCGALAGLNFYTAGRNRYR